MHWDVTLRYACDYETGSQCSVQIQLATSQAQVNPTTRNIASLSRVHTAA